MPAATGHEASRRNLRMRPTYVWRTALAPEEFIQRLRQVASFDPAVRVQGADCHASLGIPAEARHTWSPTIDVTTRRVDDFTRVCARIGPEASVWSFFVFLYAATGVTGLIGSMFGLAQLMLHDPPFALWSLPALGLAWFGLYLASFVGRGLGTDQIQQLVALLEASLSAEDQELPE